jgi:agmatine deiminase
MAWPHRQDLYGERLPRVQASYAEIARAIAEFEPVTMVAHPDHAALARVHLGNTVPVIELPIDDCWIRDSGPTYVTHGDGQVVGVSWRFNAWGGKHSPWCDDDALAGRMLALEGVDVRQSWLTCEGGSLACDGEGTLIVTETSILHPNRNPGISKSFATAELKAMLGVEKVIWLPGDPLDSETDGHIDGMCSYVRPGVVLFESNPDPRDPFSRILAENLAVLRSETDAKGRSFEVIPLEEAFDAEMTSDTFCRSYINFYLPNGGVIVPAYGTNGDARAKAVIEKAFPDRKVVQINVTAIAPGGGAIHCITQEQPRAAATGSSLKNGAIK